MNMLEYVFGSESYGETAEERAKTSFERFVRSQDHLVLWNEGAKGRVLSASEALSLFGLDALIEAVDRGSAVIAVSADEPAGTLIRRREALGLSQEDVARMAGLSLAEVQDGENRFTRTPIFTLEAMATALGLDERMLSIKPDVLKEP